MVQQSQTIYWYFEGGSTKRHERLQLPLPFWDYCVERRACIHNLTASNLFQVHGSNPYTAETSEVGDISNLTQFKFYDWCYYREQGAAFPNDKEVLGRILGPARGEGNEMAQWVLCHMGNVVPQ